jgi:hypothetical protein
MDSNGPRPYDFMPGYPNRKPQQYMNVGYVMSPYPNKVGEGDWGPTQGGGIYYNVWNPTYPYPMNFDPRNPSIPTLAYAQDIPLANRRSDLELIRSGFFGKTAQQELPIYQNQKIKIPPSTDRTCF